VIARRLLLAYVLVTALIPLSARADPPSPSDVEAARAHYKRGVELYDEKKYEQALVELERADSLAPTHRLLYNIALVQRQLGDVAGALRSFTSYLAAASEVPPARRTEVERAMAELVAKVATATVTTNIPDAEITIDARSVGITPLAAPLRLNPGPHRIVASKARYRSETKELDLAAGDRVEIPFSLEAESPPAPATPTPQETPAPVVPAPPPPEPPVAAPPAAPPAAEPLPAAPHPRASLTWIGWAAAGTLAAGATATGVAALVASHNLDRDVDDHATSASAIHSAHGTTVGLALASDILTVSAAAAAGVTLYVTIASKRRAALSSSSTASANLAVGPGTVCLSGAF
jgi:hypothetical protein